MWGWEGPSGLTQCGSLKGGGLGRDQGEGKLNREIPFGHTVYKPNIMSVCVSLKVRV